MARLWNALEEEAKRRKLNERVVTALVDAAIGLRVKNPLYRNQASVSNQVAKYDLKRLSDEGLLLPKGEKKGRYYLAGEPVKQIRQRTKVADPIADPFQALAEELKRGRQPDLPGLSA